MQCLKLKEFSFGSDNKNRKSFTNKLKKKKIKEMLRHVVFETGYSMI
jgi:hypothetical protein